MITAFQQEGNCFIIGNIFKVMIYSIVKCAKLRGGEGKRANYRFQLTDLEFKLLWLSNTDTHLHFFKAITNGYKKKQDKTTAKAVCMYIRGQNRTTTEWFRLDVILKITQFQPPATSRDTFH